MNKITKAEAESLRGELFHMILFSMAWVLIGEYSVNFRDYAIGVILILVVVVWLGLRAIRLYDMEEGLEDETRLTIGGTSKKAGKYIRMYVLILVFEGIAVLITWSILLNRGHDNWVIPAFALIAGLHFFPLARVVRLVSYYYLGAFICLVAVAGYWLYSSGSLEYYYSNTVVAYGCAAAAVVDGLTIAARMRRGMR